MSDLSLKMCHPQKAKDSLVYSTHPGSSIIHKPWFIWFFKHRQTLALGKRPSTMSLALMPILPPGRRDGVGKPWLIISIGCPNPRPIDSPPPATCKLKMGKNCWLQLPKRFLLSPYCFKIQSKYPSQGWPCSLKCPFSLSSCFPEAVQKMEPWVPSLRHSQGAWRQREMLGVFPARQKRSPKPGDWGWHCGTAGVVSPCLQHQHPIWVLVRVSNIPYGYRAPC